MNLQVLPLRVLVSRQVIRDRMDYTDYLAGKTKSEMDMLDRLDGRFQVQASHLIVERYSGGDEMPLDELDEWQIPSSLMKFFRWNGGAEISIVETSSSEARTWVISDVDGLEKHFQLRSRGLLQSDYWIHVDDFIEDGKLISARKVFAMVDGQVDRDGPRWAKVDKGLVMEYVDSYSMDKKGNLVREFICSIPIANIKITKVMYYDKIWNIIESTIYFSKWLRKVIPCL